MLKGISFSVDNIRNRVVALCGQSGCGKSSIISLIERFYDPESGGVFFNGRNIKDLDPKWYHNQIAIVQQEPVLFSGTIRENICYGVNFDGLDSAQIDELTWLEKVRMSIGRGGDLWFCWISSAQDHSHNNLTVEQHCC